MTANDHVPTWCPARRAILLGVGAAGVAFLAGCGDEEEPGAAQATPSTGSSSARPPSAGPTTPGDPFPTDGGGGPPIGALVATSEVPVGGGAIIRDEILVVQPRRGTFKAFSVTCPHQGVAVEAPQPGATTIDCPGHNSKFDITTGERKAGPATRGLSTVAIKVQSGYVVQA